MKTESFRRKERSLVRNRGGRCVIAFLRSVGLYTAGQKRSMKRQARPRFCEVQRSRNFLSGFKASRKPGPQSTGLRPLLPFKRRKIISIVIGRNEGRKTQSILPKAHVSSMPLFYIGGCAFLTWYRIIYPGLRTDFVASYPGL